MAGCRLTKRVNNRTTETVPVDGLVIDLAPIQRIRIESDRITAVAVR